MEEISNMDPAGHRRAGVRQLAAGVLFPVMALLAFLVAASSPSLSPSGLFSRPWEISGWLLIAICAGLHRPLVPGAKAIASGREPEGACLGLGAVVLPALLILHGLATAALVGALSLVISDLLRRSLVRHFGAGDTFEGLAPVFERAVVAVLAILTAGLLEQLLRDVVARAEGLGERIVVLAAAPLCYAVVSGLCLLAMATWRSGPTVKPAQAPLVVDVVGWGLGLALTQLAVEVAWAKVLWLWPMVALLTLEAARHSILRGRADRRVGTFERLQEAHERILAESSGMGGIAEQILVECGNILPLQWFQFELPPTEDDGQAGSWAAGPDGLLTEGRPRPPARPEMLPGIHRRVHWRVIDRPLVLQAPDGEEELLATLRLWCDPRRLESGAEELFATLLPQMAASVHRARLDREARLDPLTGVPVRRVLEANLQRGYRRACEGGTPMAVIMCDIDFFKRVNDTWGHDAGDEALKLVATCLDSTRREDDLCCRYGGEEFTILLERTDGAAALQLAERLRAAVEALRFVYDEQSIPLTMSLGVAAFPELTIKTASELLLLADEALYEAKERGRNQCLLHVGRGAFRAFPSVIRQESQTGIERPA